MTAINCYALKDRAVMMTDGAFYDDQGVVYGVEKKAVSITGMSAVAAMRGDLELTRKILLGLPTYGTFDNLRALIEADMKEWLKDYGDFLSADPWWSFDISIVGWSEAEQRSKILTLEFDGELEVDESKTSRFATGRLMSLGNIWQRSNAFRGGTLVFIISTRAFTASK